jgi:hypothetical protein
MRKLTLAMSLLAFAGTASALERPGSKPKPAPAAAAAAPAQAPAAGVPTKHDVLSWPRMTPSKFGCLLEKSFGTKDKQFNCASAKKKAKADEAGTEGPSFPEAKAAALQASVKSVKLVWERGELQSVSFTLTGKLSVDEVRRLFKLPAKDNNPQANVTSISIEDCSAADTCLTLQGFDHQGAGD